MKALLIGQMVFEGSIAAIHNMGHLIKRLIITEADNLCINIFTGRLYAFTGFNSENDYELLGEVDVPDELVKKVQDYLEAKNKFDALKPQFERIFGNRRKPTRDKGEGS